MKLLIFFRLVSFVAAALAALGSSPVAFCESKDDLQGSREQDAKIQGEKYIYDEPKAWELGDAIRSGDLRRVKDLVKEGVSVQKAPTERGGYVHGAPPLCVAAMFGRAEITEFLLRQGANANSFMSSGESALHLAIYGNHYGTAKVLLENGADPNNAGGGETAPLDLVDRRKEQYDRIAAMLREHGAKRSRRRD